MTVPSFDCHIRTRVVFGAGSLAQVGVEAAKFNARRVFLIADPVVESLGHLGRIRTSLKASSIEVAGVFTEIPADSEVSVVNRIADLIRLAKVDLVLGIGGGSALDTTKSANIVATLGGTLLDHQGIGVIPEKLNPWLAIPTTAGTGSEVSHYAMVKDPSQKQKLPFYSPGLAADTALLDPELCLTLPARLTAATGMDALTHAVESVLAQNAHPFSDAFAFSALRKIFRYLPHSVADGKDLEARGEMLVASCAAGIAFTLSGVGIVHAMAHACGAIAGVHHGTANSILLPYGMEFNLEALPERRRALAHAAGLREEDLRREIEHLAHVCGLPTRLREVGVREVQLPDLAAYAMTDGSMIFNPRPAEETEVLGLLKAAF
jgi:alcohol dehydrogenase class IV